MSAGNLETSGNERVFSTGSKRDRSEGKGRYDLISPIALAELAKHLEHGAKRYDERNWEKGRPLSVLLDSGIRHTYRYLAGERGENHLAAAMFNIMAAIHTREMIRRGLLTAELDDLPDYTAKGDDANEAT